MSYFALKTPMSHLIWHVTFGNVLFRAEEFNGRCIDNTIIFDFYLQYLIRKAYILTYFLSIESLLYETC